MDKLLDDFNKSFQVTPNQRRKNMHKSHSMGDIQENRAKRRSDLLEIYKKKRSSLVNEARGLLNDAFNENYGDEWMDWSEVTRDSNHRKWLNPQCKNQLMLSEWLVDRPDDLETGWTCVVCPKGRRCLVIAKMGSTRSYYKSGILAAKFKSILPSGAPSNKTRDSNRIILDCIWVGSTKQLFALDVLYWTNQPLLDSDAQFRLYWLKSKLSEVKAFQPKPKPLDVYDVFLPPHCSFSQLATTLSEQDPSQVDGILFFHNKAPYVSGQTPLVGWLKPYMLYERFGLTVTEQYMAYQPENYVNLEQWVSLVTNKHKKFKQKGGMRPPTRRGDMDCSNVSGCLEVPTEEMEETENGSG